MNLWVFLEQTPSRGILDLPVHSYALSMSPTRAPSKWLIQFALPPEELLFSFPYILIDSLYCAICPLLPNFCILWIISSFPFPVTWLVMRLIFSSQACWPNSYCSSLNCLVFFEMPPWGGVSVFFFLICPEFLYVLDINALSVSNIVNIFPHSVTCLLIYSMMYPVIFLKFWFLKNLQISL